jgi:hypothetical protein
MKKLFLSLTLISIFCLSGFAQSGKPLSYSKGISTLSAGYGAGIIWQGFILGADERPSAKTGSFHIIYEYGLSDRTSIGVSVAYASVTEHYAYNNIPNNYDDITNKLSSSSIILRANYHFGTSKKWIRYIGGGIAYNLFTYNYTKITTDSSTTPPTITKSTSNPFFVGPHAITLNIQLGMKYYFTPTLGAYAELGFVNDSYLLLGLTYRFPSDKK